MQRSDVDGRRRRNEMVIAQIDLVVDRRRTGRQIDDMTTGCLQYAVACSDVPLAGAGEARIDADVAAREAPELERRADAIFLVEAVGARKLCSGGDIVKEAD